MSETRVRQDRQDAEQEVVVRNRGAAVRKPGKDISLSAPRANLLTLALARDHFLKTLGLNVCIWWSWVHASVVP